MKNRKLYPEVKFNDHEPLKINMADLKLTKKDKEIIEEVLKIVKL